MNKIIINIVAWVLDRYIDRIENKIKACDPLRYTKDNWAAEWYYEEHTKNSKLLTDTRYYISRLLDRIPAKCTECGKISVFSVDFSKRKPDSCLYKCNKCDPERKSPIYFNYNSNE